MKRIQKLERSVIKEQKKKKKSKAMKFHFLRFL